MQKKFTSDLREKLLDRRNLIVSLVNKVPGFKAHTPNACFYLFVNVTEAMKMKNVQAVEAFRKLVLKETGVSFCTREHFGAPLANETQKYIRFAYASLEKPMIEEAFAVLSKWMAK